MGGEVLAKSLRLVNIPMDPVQIGKAVKSTRSLILLETLGHIDRTPDIPKYDTDIKRMTHMIQMSTQCEINMLEIITE